MTNRERLFRALQGEPVDQVPVWLLFPYHKTNYYVDVRNNPAYREVFEASKRHAIMLNRRNLVAPLFNPEVSDIGETVMEAGWRVERRTIRFRDIRLVSEIRQRGSGETEVKRMLNSEEDLLAFCSLPVENDANRLHQSLEAQLPVYLKEKDEFPRDYGAMMLDLGEPVSPLYHASNLQEYPVWSVTRNSEVVGLLDRLMERSRIIYDFCLSRDLADVYFLVGSELAAPPMVGPDTFSRWIVPYSKELIAMVRRSGKKTIQHFHGRIKTLLPFFREMAPDGLHTIEAPPVGNCTLSEAFEETGNAITLIGNIQYEDMRSFSEERMRRTVREVLEEGQGRRFILSPSAGPFLENLTDQMIRNYLILMEMAAAHGGDHARN